MTAPAIQHFQQEYRGIPTSRTPKEMRVAELALDYHTKVESFDAAHCTDKIKGVPWPTSLEREAISRNAAQVREEVVAIALNEGISKSEILSEIVQLRRKIRCGYVPPKSHRLASDIPVG